MFLPTDLRHCLDSVEGGPDKRFKGVAGTSDSPRISPERLSDLRDGCRLKAVMCTAVSW